MRQCPLCHRVYDSEVSFCLEDGSLLTDAHDAESARPRTARLSIPPGSIVPKRTNTALWLLLGLAAVAAAFFVVRELSDDKRTQTTTDPRTIASGSPRLVSTPEPQRESATPAAPSPGETPAAADGASSRTSIVVPETLELKTDGWKAYPFTVGDNGGRVTGEYAARGGIADDMRVIIIAENELEPFRNKYPFRSYHDTGKTTGGRLNVPLPPGGYYLIIVNPSTWTSRRIRAPISLENN